MTRFTYLVNLLKVYVHTSNLFVYADDRQIYFNGTSIETVAFSLKKETENVSQWHKDSLLQAIIRTNTKS